ncbi:MAG TPA: DegT/DnrJ/EryC1/StrS family aminotransferase [Chloroflexota bacterium]|nr:DegT/DnrJ/EryC1/StrS family aminotransferase [Chloroflexota bacterium]
MPTLAIRGGAPARTRPFPAWPDYDEREEQALLAVLKTRHWSSAPLYYRDDPTTSQVYQFEQEFATYHGVKRAVAVGSGTDALHVAYRTAGVGLGDEVIIPCLTFIATASPILQLGGVPIFVDVDAESRCISPDAVEAAITSHTKLIVPMHSGGHPADMDRLTEIARRHGIPIVADAAHAHGSEWRGKKLPAWAALSAFSLQQEKQVTPGEGGIILTDDDSLADLAYVYHNDGRGLGAEGSQFVAAGWNYRMSEFQAAIARVQLSRLDALIERKSANVATLSAKLEELGGGVRFPRSDPRITRQSYLYPSLRYDAAKMHGVPAEAFAAALVAEGVPCGARSPVPLYRHPVFAERRFGPPGRAARIPHPAEAIDYAAVHCPVAEDLAGRGLSVPQEVLLGDEDTMAQVVTAFEKVIRQVDALVAVGAHGS